MVKSLLHSCTDFYLYLVSCLALCNSVLSVSASEISWQNNKPIRVCLLTHARPGKMILHLHLATSIDYWKPNWSIIQNMTSKYNFCFWIYKPGPENEFVTCCVGKNMMHFAIHILKVNNAGVHIAHANWHQPTVFFSRPASHTDYQ